MKHTKDILKKLESKIKQLKKDNKIVTNDNDFGYNVLVINQLENIIKWIKK